MFLIHFYTTEYNPNDSLITWALRTESSIMFPPSLGAWSLSCGHLGLSACLWLYTASRIAIECCVSLKTPTIIISLKVRAYHIALLFGALVSQYNGWLFFGVNSYSWNIVLKKLASLGTALPCLAITGVRHEEALLMHSNDDKLIGDTLCCSQDYTTCEISLQQYST